MMFLFQAAVRVVVLEELIQQAQSREGQILEVSQWMSEVMTFLQHKLDADLLAGDMPEEYEVSCYR